VATCHTGARYAWPWCGGGEGIVSEVGGDEEGQEDSLWCTTINSNDERRQLSSFVVFVAALPRCSQLIGPLHSSSPLCGVDVACARSVGDMA
jgi:hypothetical protein